MAAPSIQAAQAAQVQRTCTPRAARARHSGQQPRPLPAALCALATVVALRRAGLCSSAPTAPPPALREVSRSSFRAASLAVWVASGGGATLLGTADPAAALIGYQPTRRLDGGIAPRLPEMVLGKNITEFSATDSGLRYLDLRAGDGEECCGEGVSVDVEWRLRRVNGYPIDISTGFVRKQPAAPDAQEPPPTSPQLTFVPRRLVNGIRGVGMRDDVVEGVREGVLGMRIGGSRRILVPPELGWLSEDQQPMPVDEAKKDRLGRCRREALVIDVQLKSIGSKQA